MLTAIGAGRLRGLLQMEAHTKSGLASKQIWLPLQRLQHLRLITIEKVRSTAQAGGTKRARDEEAALKTFKKGAAARGRGALGARGSGRKSARKGTDDEEGGDSARRAGGGGGGGGRGGRTGGSRRGWRGGQRRWEQARDCHHKRKLLPYERVRT
ncbi:hypothetical protein T492DRAFT_1098148 [Pavlovales sp. CCMP2436]|nr:hypothetical protein T492DRAFT_1098148 [Pavlovales sp. CCMP2436]